MGWAAGQLNAIMVAETERAQAALEPEVTTKRFSNGDVLHFIHRGDGPCVEFRLKNSALGLAYRLQVDLSRGYTVDQVIDQMWKSLKPMERSNPFDNKSIRDWLNRCCRGIKPY